MSTPQAPAGATLSGPDSRRQSLGLVDLLFLLSALLVPLEIKLVASLTVYDLVMVALAFLILVGSRRLELLPSRFMPAIYFFLLFALLSTLRASHPWESLTQILEFVFIFFVQLPVILTLTRSQSMLRMSLLLFFAGTMVGTVWALIYHHVQGAGRVLTFYSDNPNRLGYPTAYLLPIALYFSFDLWRRRRHILTVVVGLPVLYLLLWGLAASGSRSTAAGTVAALMVFLSFRKGFKLDPKVALRIASTMVVIGLLGYLLYRTDYFPATLRTRIDRTLDFEQSLVEDRRRLAIAGWRAFLESPFVGVGLDNFGYVARDYVPLATGQAPHNMWIQFLSQVGVIGTLGFLALILYWFSAAFRAQRTTPDGSRRELLWALIASMTAILTIYMFLPIMVERQYWLVYGLGLAVALDSGETPRSAPAGRLPKGYP